MKLILGMIISFTFVFSFANESNEITFENLVTIHNDESGLPIYFDNNLKCHEALDPGTSFDQKTERKWEYYDRYTFEEILVGSGFLDGQKIPTGKFKSKELSDVRGFIYTPYGLEGISKRGKISIREKGETGSLIYTIALFSKTDPSKIIKISFCK